MSKNADELDPRFLEYRCGKIIHLMTNRDAFKNVLEMFKKAQDYPALALYLSLSVDDMVKVNTLIQNFANANTDTQKEQLLAAVLKDLLEANLDLYLNAKKAAMRAAGKTRSEMHDNYVDIKKALEDHNDPIKGWAGFQQLFSPPQLHQKMALFATYRANRAFEKQFMVEMMQRGPDDGVVKRLTEDAQKKRTIPEKYITQPGEEERTSFLHLQQNYTPGGKSSSVAPIDLLRVYNIGLDQEQVLKVMRTLDPNKSLNTILPGYGVQKDSEGKDLPNPCRKITFKYFDQVYGVTGRLNDQGKIEYLYYNLNAYENKGAMTDEEFIEKHAKLMPGECFRRPLANGTIQYAHRDDSYNTVGEALNEQFHHLSHAMGKDLVYTNMKGYVYEGDAAGLDNKENCGPKKAGAALELKPGPSGGGSGSTALSTKIK